MAQSLRKVGKPGSKSAPILQEDALKRRERLTLVLYLLGAVAIVAGMILLSEFLAQAKADKQILYITGGLFGVFIVGMGVTYAMRKLEK